MSDIALPTHELTFSERVLIWSLRALTLVCVAMLIGAFLQFPVPIGGIAFFWGWRQWRKRRLPKLSQVHGKAHFASDGEIAVAGFSGNTEGLILGKTVPKEIKRGGGTILPVVFSSMKEVIASRLALQRYVAPKGWRKRPAPTLIRLPMSDKRAHVACYMPSGAGKTRGVVIPNLLNLNENAVVYDPSGETYRETAEHRRSQMGHDIRLIDPFSVCGVKECDRFNVMDLVAPDDPGYFDYGRNLAHALVPEKLSTNQDPFWHASEVSATEFLLGAIALSGDAKLRTLRTLGEFLNAQSFHDLAETYATHPDDALRRRALQMQSYKEKTLNSLLACLSADHSWMDAPAFGHCLSGSSFSVRSLFQRKITLYIVIPGNRAVESQAYVRVLIAAILYAAFEVGADIRRPPVRLYLDEAATLGRLEQLTTMYTQGRKFGLRSVTFFQSVGQVAEIMGGPEKVHNFRSNMGAELFKPKDYQTAKEVSEWIGQTTVRTQSNSFQGGSNSGSSYTESMHSSRSGSSGTNSGWSDTYNETGVAVLRPEEVLQLGERQAILVSAGTPPIKLDILDPREVATCTSGLSPRGYIWRVRSRALVASLFAPMMACVAAGTIAMGMEQWNRPVVRSALRDEREHTNPAESAGQSIARRQKPSKRRAQNGRGMPNGLKSR